MGPLPSFILPSIHPYPCLSDPHLSSLKTWGLDGSSVWEPLLSYIVLRGAKEKRKNSEWGNPQTIVQQCNNKKSKTFLPIAVYSKQLQKCQSTVSLIRADQLQCCFMYPNVSVYFSDWTLHQACRFCLCMCLCARILCQCQEPLRRGGLNALWEWDLVTQAALPWLLQSGGRKKFLLYMCALNVIVRSHVCVMWVSSWINHCCSKGCLFEKLSMVVP